MIDTHIVCKRRLSSNIMMKSEALVHVNHLDVDACAIGKKASDLLTLNLVDVCSILLLYKHQTLSISNNTSGGIVVSRIHVYNTKLYIHGATYYTSPHMEQKQHYEHRRGSPLHLFLRLTISFRSCCFFYLFAEASSFGMC